MQGDLQTSSQLFQGFDLWRIKNPVGDRYRECSIEKYQPLSFIKETWFYVGQTCILDQPVRPVTRNSTVRHFNEGRNSGGPFS